MQGTQHSFERELVNNPDLRFRIDSFSVPERARAEFEAAMQRNMAFIATLPGFRGHVVFDKVAGPGRFDVVTIAAWESDAALAAAGAQVRAYYAQIGFDPQKMISEWGATGELASFRARAQ